MSERDNGPSSSNPRKLAIAGAMITGVAGIVTAVYSVVGGQVTGGGALLAASALAFGLLAANVDRAFSRRSESESSTTGDGLNGLGTALQAAIESAVASGKEQGAANGESDNGARPGDAATAVAQVDAEPITDRERQVLALVAEGFSNKLISSELGIAERTVKNHLTVTMGKLRASDRTHAVVTAVRMGWLEI